VRAPILLVHGAFHTGDCWELLTPLLEEAGHSVHVVTLDGHRGNPCNAWGVTMKRYGRTVVRHAQEIGSPVIVVGHSMGGLVISEAAERRPDLFSAMIYLTAIVPRSGRSSMLSAAPVSSQLRGATRPRRDGTASFLPEAAKRVFYHRCAPDIQEWAVARLSPQPVRASFSAIRTTPARLGSVRKHFIQCTDDRVVPITSQRTMAGRLGFASVVSVESDHSPFLSKPAELAEVMTRIVAG
jgi:pimeloyl-ACP methyl ester carboxylesterase